jgi:NAD(P)-dependent dehydrogenase (short-subunit alcohol dehydrogenase family)
MIQQGARHLVFLSRSGATKPEAQVAINSFEAQGANVAAIRCDITDPTDVRYALDSIADRYNFPPVRGLIQASMVLNVSIPD